MALEVLVVDDEADIRELVAGVLEDEGYAVRSAANSTEALEAIESRRPASSCSTSGCKGRGWTGSSCWKRSSGATPPCRS
jgi:DNA-binding NtrC family response regulator